MLVTRSQVVNDYRQSCTSQLVPCKETVSCSCRPDQRCRWSCAGRERHPAVGCQHAPDRCRHAIVDGDTATAQRHAMCARAKARFALCFTFTSQIKITQRTRLEFCDSARKMSQAIYFGSTDNILVNFLRSLALCTFQCMQQWHGCSCS